MNPTVFEISLIAAYIAGVVALFAPCCISYLLPAYLGNVFKERKQVLLMTFIYSLGIFTVLLPIVLGAKAFANFFFTYHDQSYLLGGLLMIGAAFLALFGFKLPMPHLTTSRTGTDPLSTYILGLVSGITSACCAPVLMGVLTLSAITPSLFQAVIVGSLYVLGMVTPLYIAASVIHKKNILMKPFLRKTVTILKFGNTSSPIMVSNVVAFGVFFVTGFMLMALTLGGKLSMDESAMAAAESISNVAASVTALTKRFPFLDTLFGVGMLLLVFRYLKAIQTNTAESSCCAQPSVSQGQGIDDYNDAGKTH